MAPQRTSSVTERNLVNPIDGEQMAHIVVRNRPIFPGMDGIEDLAKVL